MDDYFSFSNMLPEYEIEMHRSNKDPHFEIKLDGEIVAIISLSKAAILEGNKIDDISIQNLNEYLKETPPECKGLSRWDIMCIDWNHLNPCNKFTPPKEQPDYNKM